MAYKDKQKQKEYHKQWYSQNLERQHNRERIRNLSKNIYGSDLSTVKFKNMTPKERFAYRNNLQGALPNARVDNKLGIKNISYDNTHRYYVYKKVINGNTYKKVSRNIEVVKEYKKYIEDTYFSNKQLEIRNKYKKD